MNQDLSTQLATLTQEITLSALLLGQNYVAIPLKKYPTGHFYSDIVLNDQPGIFLLDTGAGFTLFEEKRRHKFNIKATPSPDIGTGAGGTGIVIELSAHNQLSIGQFTTSNCLLRVMTLESINARFRAFNYPEIDGAIGADLLTAGKAIIDYVNLTLYLKPEDGVS